MKHAIIISSLISAVALYGDIRTWTSADGSKTFEGKVISYNDLAKTVTMDIDGVTVSFDEDKLSKEDLDYLSKWDSEKKTTSIKTSFQRTNYRASKKQPLLRAIAKKLLNTTSSTFRHLGDLHVFNLLHSWWRNTTR